jgi:peptide methionine sulfoxide reductase msrA/msrB
MKTTIMLGLFFVLASCQSQPLEMKSKVTVKNKNVEKSRFRKLTTEEKRVIIDKGTEYPGTGEFNNFKKKGIFRCKQCNDPLYSSSAKFHSGCGWPSFDDAIEGNVREVSDADGRRTEIVCESCSGHLGHVFRGEQFTPKNTRHCVNSISLIFEPEPQSESESESKADTAVFASGCFWGTEYFLQQIKGVIDTKSGYIGGSVENPTYREVCSGKTGHAEAVQVIFDPDSVTYEELAKLYFETHDPTQVDRQGPDIGTQYRSEIFYFNDLQKKISESLIQQLQNKGLTIATKLTKASTFWVAEEYHQDYYIKTGKQPYCHSYKQLF